MEKDKLKLKLTSEEENSLTHPLIAMGTDLLNNQDIDKESIIKLYLYSQQNCRMMQSRLEELKDRRKVSLSEETVHKIAEFRKASRRHVFAGGECFRDEDEALSFLLDLGLKFGFSFLEKMLNDDNFKSVTSTMEPEGFDNPEERNKKIEKDFEENGD